MTSLPPKVQEAVDEIEQTWPGQHIVTRYDWCDAIRRCAEMVWSMAEREAAWQPMATVPRREDSDPVLLLHRIHGVVEARYAPGEWSDETPDHPREYDGPVWICGDDAWQEEIEEQGTDDDGIYHYHDGGFLGWLPRNALPLADVAPQADGPTAREDAGESRLGWRSGAVSLDPRDPDHSRQGIFQTHNCWKCGDGRWPCRRGNPNQCEYPHARND